MCKIDLYCGDCIDIMNQLINKNIKVDAIITDPPYFVLPKGKKGDNFKWDHFKNMDDFETFTTMWFNKCYSILNDNSFMFIFWSQKHINIGTKIFNPNRIIIWNYNNLVLGGNGDFAYDYEPIMVVKKGKPKLIKGKHSCILKYTKPQSNFKKDKLIHPTQKPLELIKKIIGITEAKIILDPFAGGGTTLVACKELNRNGIGIEIDENYFNVAKERLK